MRTWILSIVRHRGVDLLRSRASRRRTQDKVEAPAVKVQPSEAFSETWRNSHRNQVREALKALPSEKLKILEQVSTSLVDYLWTSASALFRLDGIEGN